MVHTLLSGGRVAYKQDPGLNLLPYHCVSSSASQNLDRSYRRLVVALLHQAHRTERWARGTI
jgi:hypothetical protein